METEVRRLLLAGSTGPERAAARIDTEDPRWFEPLHVRDPAAARERLASQIAAGADVVVAPTWQTHRRALLPVGETRRARAWTIAAVDIARQGVDEGLERREQAVQEHDTPGEHAGDHAAVHDVPERPVPIVTGVLPRLDDEAALQTGRLATANVAEGRDYRDQAGLLADGGIEAILIEGLRTISSTRAAIEAVTTSGLPAWVAAPGALAPTDPEATSLWRWVETCVDAGAARLLAPAPIGPASASAINACAAPLAASQRPWGAQLDDDTTSDGIEEAGADDYGLVATWFEQGASLIARLDAATPAALASTRAAIDRTEAKATQEATRRQLRWRSFVGEAARAAAGGEALWLDDNDDAELPDGFAWTCVHPDEVSHLPQERYRLIISTTQTHRTATLLPLLEPGGMLVLEADEAILATDGLRLLRIEDLERPVLALLRRED